MSEIKIPEHFKLTEGEVPHWHGRVCPALMYGVVLLEGIATVFFLLLYYKLVILNNPQRIDTMLYLLISYFVVASAFTIILLKLLIWEYLITNKRIHIRRGREIREIGLEGVRALDVKTNFLNCGSVYITTDYGDSVVLRNIPAPMKVKGIIEELLSKK